MGNNDGNVILFPVFSVSPLWPLTHNRICIRIIVTSTIPSGHLSITIPDNYILPTQVSVCIRSLMFSRYSLIRQRIVMYSNSATFENCMNIIYSRMRKLFSFPSFCPDCDGTKWQMNDPFLSCTSPSLC